LAANQSNNGGVTIASPVVEGPPTAQPVPAPIAAQPQAADRNAGANVVVLASDPTLLELLKHSLEGRQRVWRADNAMHAADLLVAAQSGILLIDAGGGKDDTPSLVDSLHTQFPDLPIVVAGRRDDELKLGERISSGIVFRFLHKPASADRVRNFVEAAARRLKESPSPGPARPDFGRLAAARSLRLPSIAIDHAEVMRRLRRALPPLLVLLAVAAVAVLVQRIPWRDLAPSRSRTPASAQASSPAPAAAPQLAPDIARLLSAAGVALSQGRLASPPGQNAIEFYRAVLLREPDNAEARRGLARTAEALLLDVEKALEAGDTMAAASTLDSARSADPTNARLDFYSSLLVRERVRRQDVAPPQAGIEASAERARAEHVGRLLSLADARMRQARLSGGDSAETYLLEARTADPDDPGVQQALTALSGRMLLEANQALRDGDSRSAAVWLDRTSALGVDAPAVARLRAELESARVASVQEDRSRLLALANQRIAQGRLTDPAGDSARHYVDLLRSADPSYPGLEDTEALLASRLQEGEGGEAPRGQLPAAAARAVAAQEVLPENELARVLHPPADYPPRARARGIEGWVEVQFTVTADGATRDPVVIGASPAGVFDQAVLDSIAKWRYEPRRVAGAPVDQRVQLRVRFQLSGR